MQGNVILGVPLAFTILGVLAVGLRFYVRTANKTLLGWDDWTMLLAVVIEIVNRSLTTLSTLYDIRVPPTTDDAVEALKYNYIALPFQVMVSVIARLSIMLLLIRLFSVHKWFKRFLIILFSILSLLSIVFIPITFCQVTPAQALWNYTLVVTKRWNPNIWLYWACVTQSVYTFSDLAFVMLPVMIIWNLNMPLRQKIGLILLMAMSLLTMVMSIMRTVWIVASYGGTPAEALGKYNQTSILALALLEGDMVIIMGCIPTLRSLMKLDLSRFGSSISNLFTRPKTKPSTVDKSYSSSGPYHDLELSTRKLAAMGPGESIQVSTAAFQPDDKSQDQFLGGSEVRQTNHFSITYKLTGDTERYAGR